MRLTGMLKIQNNAMVAVHKVHEQGSCMQIPGSILLLINTPINTKRGVYDNV